MEKMVSTEVVRVRGLEIGKGMPKICVPVAETSREEILRAAREAGNSAADLLEWRADCYEEGADRRKVQSLLLSIRREIGDMPLLFTFRTREEGGAGLCDLSPRDYLWLNYCALERRGRRSGRCGAAGRRKRYADPGGGGPQPGPAYRGFLS